MKRKEEENLHLCLLDFNYSSRLLSIKIADIPHKLKYETIIAPIFEYCFGTSDQDKVWEYLTEDENYMYENIQEIYESNNDELPSILTQIDFIKDETFIYSQIFNLVNEKLNILARKFGLWNNRDFVLNCIYNSVNIFEFNGDKHFRNDRELIMAAVKESGSFLQYASDELKNDKEIVMQAVKRIGNALEYSSLELKDDKEIVLTAIEQSVDSFKYASERLKDDRELNVKAISLGGFYK